MLTYVNILSFDFLKQKHIQRKRVAHDKGVSRFKWFSDLLGAPGSCGVASPQRPN